jgi:hypothetical protein
MTLAAKTQLTSRPGPRLPAPVPEIASSAASCRMRQNVACSRSKSYASRRQALDAEGDHPAIADRAYQERLRQLATGTEH